MNEVTKFECPRCGATASFYTAFVSSAPECNECHKRTRLDHVHYPMVPKEDHS